VGSVAHLWNPRGNQRLRRHWISFGEQIVIGGESLAQAGELSLRPSCPGELHARLRVMGREFHQAVQAGNDIVLWINGLTLFIGVKALDNGRLLVAFGVAPGARVNVTLDAGTVAEGDTEAIAAAHRDAVRESSRGPIGLCQTSM